MIFLKQYENYDKIKNFLKNNNFPLENWKIYNKTIEERTSLIQENTYYKKFINIADFYKISYNKTEIISWIDNLFIIYRTLEGIKEKINNLKIIQEMNIPFTKKRADIILIKDDKILIIEFSYNKWDEEYRYSIKLEQAITYKELLKNILPENIKIANYTFLIKPEEENELSNEESIKNLQKYILYFFHKSEDIAYETLNNICNSIDSIKI